MKLRVLVADDDPLMQVLTSVSLGEIAETWQARDGNETLRLLRREPFDLLLLDWNMPGADGLEVLQVVRDEGIRVPVIMVTAEAEKAQILKAARAGAADYMIKPFDGDTLYWKVKRFLPTTVNANSV